MIRPDVPQLSDDPLLVRCYDLNIIDSRGELQMPQINRMLMGRAAQAAPFRKDGFFGRSNRFNRKVGAPAHL